MSELLGHPWAVLGMLLLLIAGVLIECWHREEKPHTHGHAKHGKAHAMRHEPKRQHCRLPKAALH